MLNEDLRSLSVREIRRRVVAWAGTTPEPASYQPLREALDTVPKSERGGLWRETSILLDALFRMDHRRTQTRLARTRARRRDSGRTKDFEKFYALVQHVLGADTLTLHGYGLALAERDQPALWREVSELVKEIERDGLSCFAVSGTLLGIVRSGEMISYDTDIDLAVLLRTPDPHRVADEWTAVRRDLRLRGLLDEEHEAGKSLHAKARSRDAVGIDLFPAWVAHGQVHIWPIIRSEVGEESLLPLRSHAVADVEVRIPRDPEPFLIANYGSDWRTPDPTWQFDWRAAHARFVDFTADLERAR